VLVLVFGFGYGFGFGFADFVFLLPIVSSYFKEVLSRSYVLPNPSLQEEFAILKRISHANVINVGDLFENEEFVLFAEELVTGDNLFAQLARWQRPFAEHDFVLLFRQIFAALRLMHQHALHLHVNATHEAVVFKSFHVGCREIKLVDIGHEYFVENQSASSFGSLLYYTTFDEDFACSCNASDVLAVGLMLLLLISDLSHSSRMDVNCYGMVDLVKKHNFMEAISEMALSDELKSFFGEFFAFVSHCFPLESTEINSDAAPETIADASLLLHHWQYALPDDKNTVCIISPTIVAAFLVQWPRRSYQLYRCSGKIIPPNTTLWDYELQPGVRPELRQAMWRVNIKEALLNELRKNVRDSPFHYIPSELFTFICVLFRIVTW
jgi:hypothetical protein